MTVESTTVSVSRTIQAPASIIFKLLANPQKHQAFDGSDMLRGAVEDRPLRQVGDTFTMRMRRLGDDYLMLNHVVEFEPNRRIFWEPAPGDSSRTAGNDPAKVGIPAGYRWGYTLTPSGGDATIVTEVFDCGRVSEEDRQNLLSGGGRWINGSHSMRASMTASLEMLERITVG